MPRHTIPPIDHKRDELQAKDFLTELRTATTTAGIEMPAIDEALEMLTRIRDHQKALRAEVSTHRSDTRDIAEGLVDGSLNINAAAKASAKIEATGGAVLAAAARQTPTVAVGQAMRHVANSINGDDVFDQCRTIVAGTIDAVRELRAPLAGITTADQAIDAGPEQASAWSRYKTELIPRWEAAHEVVRLMRTQHWIPPFPLDPERGLGGLVGTAAAHARAPRYALVQVMADLRWKAKRSGREFLELLDPAIDDAQPGGPYTLDEYAEIRHRRYGALRALDEAERAHMAKGRA